MSGFTFRPAVRENVGLILGFAGPSGSGKTFSALRAAKGLANGKKFAVIDTEARRATHYADHFDFDHGDLAPPFSPERYLEAIRAADAAHYPVIVVDSFSHEHSGEGGVLDCQQKELDLLVKRALERKGESRPDWQLRDTYNQLSWQRPKGARKRMIQALLQIRAHLILCLRAEDKVEFAKDKEGKTVVRPKETLSGFKGWIPICGKELPFEMTASFLLLPDKPGVPNPIKLPEDLRQIVKLDKPIDEETGRRLGEWAAGGKPATKPAAAPPVQPAGQPLPGTIDERQIATLGEKAKARAKELGLKPDYILRSVLTKCGFDQRKEVTVEKFSDVVEFIENWTQADAA